jgi:hypothetical protein
LIRSSGFKLLRYYLFCQIHYFIMSHCSKFRIILLFYNVYVVELCQLVVHSLCIC